MIRTYNLGTFVDADGTASPAVKHMICTIISNLPPLASVKFTVNSRLALAHTESVPLFNDFDILIREKRHTVTGCCSSMFLRHSISICDVIDVSQC